MPGPPEAQSGLQESEVFHILGNDRRRSIIHFMALESGSVDVSDVATDIAEQESEDSTVPNNLYKSVYVSLQQTHLPQLEEDGVVRYDEETKRIEPGANFTDVTAYIEGEQNATRRIVGLHLVLSLLGLLAIALVGTVVPSVSDTVLIAGSVLIFMVIAGTSLYRLFA
ncbi:MAG: ArsR family transcriptional regulator [Natrialbaceae archaeon]|nr:ArsR family transcriptional regulator [Natrialbaceae archaeon]